MRAATGLRGCSLTRIARKGRARDTVGRGPRGSRRIDSGMASLVLKSRRPRRWAGVAFLALVLLAFFARRMDAGAGRADVAQGTRRTTLSLSTERTSTMHASEVFSQEPLLPLPRWPDSQTDAQTGVQTGVQADAQSAQSTASAPSNAVSTSGDSSTR